MRSVITRRSRIAINQPDGKGIATTTDLKGTLLAAIATAKDELEYIRPSERFICIEDARDLENLVSGLGRVVEPVKRRIDTRLQAAGYRFADLRHTCRFSRRGFQTLTLHSPKVPPRARAMARVQYVIKTGRSWKRGPAGSARPSPTESMEQIGFAAGAGQVGQRQQYAPVGAPHPLSCTNSTMSHRIPPSAHEVIASASANAAATTSASSASVLQFETDNRMPGRPCQTVALG